MKPFDVLKIHQAIRNALAHSTSEEELENIRLKKITSKLEAGLNP